MKILKAKYNSSFKFGKYCVKVAILENNTYVLSERDVSLFIGGRGGSSFNRKAKNTNYNQHISLSASNLKEFIDPTLEKKLSNRIKYFNKNKNTLVYGYDATTVTEICWVWLRAKESGKLLKCQEKTYQRVNAFFRALSTIGIINLIKEVAIPATTSPTDPNFWNSLKTKCQSLITNIRFIPEKNFN